MKLVTIIGVLAVFTVPSISGREYMGSLTPGDAIDLHDADDRIVATVKPGEKFFVLDQGAESGTVFLKSGITGTMDLARVRELPDEPLMKLNYAPARKEWKEWRSQPGEHEVTISARKRGVEYYPTLVRASEGDASALKKIFALAPFMDGGAAESYVPQIWELCHLVGDQKFATAVRRQPTEVRTILGYSFADESCPLADPKSYLQRHFPETCKALQLSKQE